MKERNSFPVILAFLLAFSSYHLLVEASKSYGKGIQKHTTEVIESDLNEIGQQGSNSNGKGSGKNNKNEEMELAPEGPIDISEPRESEDPSTFIILGYYTKYWSTDLTSYQSLTSYYSNMNAIAMATYDVTSSGIIEGFDPQEGVEFANAHSVKPYVTIQNKFDPNVANQILTDANLKQTAITNMLELVKIKGFQGINLNFENMFASDRVHFNQFVKELVAVFHANDYPVIVSVPAKTEDFPTWAWSGTFEYKKLGELADYIQIMSYDQHGSWGDPGPVAGVNWMENVLAYAANEIPSEKLIIGLPAYAYDWNLTNSDGNKALTWKTVITLIQNTDGTVQWDNASQSPFFDYTASNGDKHTVWFENEKSIEIKTRLVHKYNLAGVSMWRMGQEDEHFWMAVEKGLTN
ncbi:glycosyl hydrolase family 18 protein [Alkalihalobacillus deserti]|uniref:glycosyl hydrolase family 18 protein n=1 Tax=Alkalihalobacillus deserti TaxID=2879466 RepID=UPI001D151C8D|nr:glycosyl hydrolase family 18 protein [Alkalihalobacillus deserti]